MLKEKLAICPYEKNYYEKEIIKIQDDIKELKKELIEESDEELIEESDEKSNKESN